MTNVLEAELRALCERGEYLTDADREPRELSGVIYQHKGNPTIAVVDEQKLPGFQKIYAGGKLRSALQNLDVSTAPLKEALQKIKSITEQDGLILGFSGFASPTPNPSINFKLEGAAMKEIYQHLTHINQLPKLVVDGGGGEGILGLNGVLAKQFGVASLGILPMRGLSTMAPRDEILVWGDSFKDREILVGIMPDVLICVGGAEGTRRECEEALKRGGVVLLVALKNYGEQSFGSTYANFPEMQKGLNEGRLIVCGPGKANALLPKLDQALSKHAEVREINVAQRLATINSLFDPRTLEHGPE